MPRLGSLNDAGKGVRQKGTEWESRPQMEVEKGERLEEQMCLSLHTSLSGLKMFCCLIFKTIRGFFTKEG